MQQACNFKKFPLTFNRILNGMLRFIAQLRTILVLTETVFVMILEIFHERKYLNLVILLLPGSFVSVFRLELMYIFLIRSSRLSLTYIYGYQLIVLLPQFIEITSFVCAKRINLLNLKQSSGRLVIIVKWFLKLPNLHMLIKQKNPSLLRNLTLGTLGELPIVFLTKANLLQLLHSTGQRCCLLHLMQLF